MKQPWINLEYYTPLQLILFGIGALLWVVAYIVLVRNIVKKKFVEMPAGVLCANFAWETLYAFFFTQNMGLVLDIGYKLWFFLDVFIVIGFYKYGAKQVSKSATPHFRTLFTFALIGWFVALFFFIKQGADNPIGANSAYIINILISVLYILMFLRLEDKSVISATVTWSKALGTAFISVMCFLRWPENHWLLTLCAACAMLDAYYIYLFYKYSRQESGVRDQ